MSILNPFKNAGAQLQNGLLASYNPFKATKDVVGGATAAPSPGPSTASDIYANLTRQQWENYVSTFVPIENKLIAYATDSSLPGQAMQQAATDVDNAYATQAGTQARKLAGMGIALDPSQQAASTRATGLSHALASVQAQNTARDITIGNQQSILGNPTPTTASIAQQASGLGV